MAVLRDSFDGPELVSWNWPVVTGFVAGWTIDGKLNITPDAPSRYYGLEAQDVDITFGDELSFRIDLPAYAGGINNHYRADVALAWDADDIATPETFPLGSMVQLALTFSTQSGGGWAFAASGTGFQASGAVQNISGTYSAAMPYYRVKFTDVELLVERSADRLVWVTLGVLANARTLEYPGTLDLTVYNSANAIVPGLTISFDDLLVGNPDDPGYYFLGLQTATTGVTGGLLSQVRPQVTSEGLAQFAAAFDLELGMIEDGVLTDTPEIGALVTSVAGVGRFEIDDQILNPFEVATNATARWMAQEGTFIEGVSWIPTEGDGALVWATDAGYSPVLDTEYTYSSGRRSISRPVLSFDGTGWMELSADQLSSPAATLIVVTALGHGLGESYGIIESSSLTPGSTGDDAGELVATGFGLRYNHGTIQVFAGAPVMSYETNLEPGQPMVLALTVGATEGRLMVVDRERSTRTFSTENFGAFDVDLVLGRVGQGFSEATNAVMALFEVVYFERALGFDELEVVVSDLCAAYGVL